MNDINRHTHTHGNDGNHSVRNKLQKNTDIYSTTAAATDRQCT